MLVTVSYFMSQLVARDSVNFVGKAAGGRSAASTTKSHHARQHDTDSEASDSSYAEPSSSSSSSTSSSSDESHSEPKPKPKARSYITPADFREDLNPPTDGKKKEWRGVPGGWEGACPLRGEALSKYEDLGIHVLHAEKQPAAVKEAEDARRKAWKPWTLPEHIRNEYSNESRYAVPDTWSTNMIHKGRQWFWIENFCVEDGKLIMFDRRMGVETADNKNTFKEAKRKKHLPLYNEFTRSRNKLSYSVQSVPRRLPGPLVDNPAWIFSFWCQDLFHSTLTLMPGSSVKRFNNSDVYIKLCKKSPCHPKLGSQLSWDDPYNPLWGNDKQFPFAGNPYWQMYRSVTDEPYRVRPLYPHKHYYPPEHPARCYREGVIDKKWFISVTRQEAINYADLQLRNFGVVRTPRQCRQHGGYRMTLINRQGATRKLANMQEVAEAAKCYGFNVTLVAFERFALRDQIEIIANTDLIVGMHGNGLIWTQFQEAGAYEIEIMGIWYERYAKLWGNGYNYTNTKDKFGKKGNEYVPFHADMAQLAVAFQNAKEHLDKTSCGEEKHVPDMTTTHKQVWEV